MTTPELHARIQYSPHDTPRAYIGTVIDIEESTLTVAPIADGWTGQTLPVDQTHQLSQFDDYRVLATPE